MLYKVRAIFPIYVCVEEKLLYSGYFLTKNKNTVSDFLSLAYSMGCLVCPNLHSWLIPVIC